MIDFILNLLKGAGKPSKQNALHISPSGPDVAIPKVNAPIDVDPLHIEASVAGPEPTFQDLSQPNIPPRPNTPGSSLDPTIFHALQWGPVDALEGHWTHPSDSLDGRSISLYDTHPVTGMRSGDPIADAYGGIQYQRGAILAVADGVNWGEKPKLAARCAVFAALKTLHMGLSSQGRDDTNTVFRHMRTALDVAQHLILERGGTLTTIVISAVLPCKKQKGRYAILTINVGDSAAFVFRHQSGDVVDLTHSRLEGARDPRNCQGCLGFALGEDPDLSNMTLSFTTGTAGDLVILGTDGLVDNFDPVMRKEAVLKREGTGGSCQGGELPVVDYEQAHAMTVCLMSKALKSAIPDHSPGDTSALTASCAVNALLDSVSAITQEHRATVQQIVMEQEAATDGQADKVAADKAAVEKVRMTHGKLDHATTLVYKLQPL